MEMARWGHGGGEASAKLPSRESNRERGPKLKEGRLEPNLERLAG